MKFQKIILQFFLLLSFLHTKGQETASLIAFPGPGNSMHYEDIWNLTIILNPINANSYYFLEIEVEEEPGNSLWKAKTYTFKIPSSPFTIFPTELSFFEPILVNFIEAGWHEKMTRGGGLFPPGKYKITYRLVETTEGCITSGKLLSAVSIIKIITSLFPPSLLFPFNKDTLDSETPVFAWSPVMPIQNNGISYSVRISEIAGNQTNEQALINNRAYLFHDAGESLTITYPPVNMPLRKGSIYAWQVIAKTSQGVLSFSETWRFTIRENEKADSSTFPHQVFLSVNNSPSGHYYFVNGSHLFIQYDEPYSDSDGGLMYVLSSSETHKVLLTGKIFPLAAQKGVNSYALDITSLKEGKYIFTITDEKGNKGYVVFNRVKAR